MKKHMVMSMCALGLTIAASDTFAESREIYNWKANTTDESSKHLVSPEMEAMIFPDQPGEIYGWNNGKKMAAASREYATTPADCVMARSYPKRSGGIELHKRLHTNHDESACR